MDEELDLLRQSVLEDIQLMNDLKMEVRSYLRTKVHDPHTVDVWTAAIAGDMLVYWDTITAVYGTCIDIVVPRVCRAWMKSIAKESK